ncbi:MAG: PorP/SprF family type IX secretion system membrane protein [Paludibacteraceae bacterium]|nr:PorP/SprF family type IX secretion system membrane protein [Paludibacteraceae bacterium]
MKKYVVLLGLLIVVLALEAQTDPQLGQYMYMQTSYNPAAAGEGDLMRVSGLHRMQFTGIKNAPMTTYFSFTSPFVIGKTKHAAGVRFLNDMYGLYSNQAFHIQYAYRHKIGKGYLSAGIDLGLVNVGFRNDSINLGQLSGATTEGNYFQETDPAIPRNTGGNSGDKGANGMAFDMGVGLYYAAPTWWASLSYSHLTRPTIQWSEQSEMTVVGTLYMAGGYNWQLHDKRWMLHPSAMIMTDFANWDVNLTMMAEVDNKYRFGAGYRIGGSVNLIVNIDIVSGLCLGYTYELPANRLAMESYGSHELFLAYGFDILKPKRTNKYKSIRYL